MDPADGKLFPTSETHLYRVDTMHPYLHTQPMHATPSASVLNHFRSLHVLP
jgi:hypothetical protein